MMNSWEQLKALLPRTSEARILVKTVELQIAIIANNMAELEADDATGLAEASSDRIEYTFGIIGEVENDVT